MRKYFLFIASFILSFSLLADNATGYNPQRASSNAPKLTDEEMLKSKTYIHEGLSAEQMREACKDKSRECAGQEINTKFLGLDGAMIKGIAKAYGVVMGMVGLNQKKKDYCSVIPMATETLATFQQTQAQNNLSALSSNQVSQQKEALYKAARSHDSRSDNSKIQFTGFAAAAACYPIQMYATGGFDWSSAAKMAASLVLAGFYQQEMKRYNDAANFARNLADQLPGSGDCNPVTQKDCFCSKESSKNMPEYVTTCIPLALQREKMPANKKVNACLDAGGRIDASCSCLRTDTCYYKTFSSEIQGLSFKEGLSKTFGPVAELTRGSLSDAGFKAAQTGLSGAFSKIKEIDPLFPVSATESFAQGDAKNYQDLGLGINLAKKLAAMAPPSTFQKDLDKIKGSASLGISLPGGDSKNVSRPSDSHVIEFGNGNMAAGGNKKGTTSSSLDFNRFMPQKNTAPANGEVINYPSDRTMNKAMNNADINSDSSKNLFEIVSRRYQLSGKNLNK